MIWENHLRQPFFLQQIEEKPAKNKKNSARKLRGTSYLSKKCAVFLIGAPSRILCKKVVSQPACLYFMMQLQNVIRHAHKIPFRLNIVVSSGQKTTKIHIFLDHGKHTFCLNGTVDPKQNSLSCGNLFLHQLTLVDKIFGDIQALDSIR